MDKETYHPTKTVPANDESTGFVLTIQKKSGRLILSTCPEVKAKIYFLSPKIQIYVFLLPASEKGLGKEKHGLTIKCKIKCTIKTNGIFERHW